MCDISMAKPITIIQKIALRLSRHGFQRLIHAMEDMEVWRDLDST